MFYNENRLRILSLNLRERYDNLFICKLDGPLIRKQAKNADKVLLEINSKLNESVKKLKWQISSRAKYAVHFSFHGGKKNMPELHNLIKFYLDTMKGIVFADDRQIWYLTANAWRPIDKKIEVSNTNEYLYIKVERIGELKRRFKIYQELIHDDDFRDVLRDKLGSTKFDEIFGNKSMNKGGYISEDTLRLLGCTEKQLENIRAYNFKTYQNNILSLNRIEPSEQPGKQNKYWSLFDLDLDLWPLLINLGSLPRVGETNNYKERIRESFSKFRENNFRISFPIELDVKVSSSKTVLGKDLDNIMRDIVPIFKEEVLSQESNIDSFRIFFASYTKKDWIIVKPMLDCSIINFESNMKEVLKVAREWVDEKIRRGRYW